MFFSTVLGGRTQPCAKTVKTAALVPSLGEGDGRRVRRVLRRSPGWKCLDVSNDERPTERNAPETKKTLESPQNQLISLDSDSFLHLHFFLFTFSLSNSFLKISNGTKRDEVTKEYTKPWWKSKGTWVHIKLSWWWRRWWSLSVISSLFLDIIKCHKVFFRPKWGFHRIPIPKDLESTSVNIIFGLHNRHNPSIFRRNFQLCHGTWCAAPPACGRWPVDEVFRWNFPSLWYMCRYLLHACLYIYI